MKASRLLSILMLLQSRERMTAAALAQALDVSDRTIMRDVDQLSAAGVPIWAERGREGGLRLREGWSTRLTGMTENEANALLLAGLPGAAAELGLGDAALSARLKLVASLPMPMRDQAAKVADRLHIDPVDWYRAHDTPTQLREVAEAVWRSARIRVRYASWRKTSWRELEPMGLILKAGAWYVAAREAGKRDVRTYRLAHVLESQSGRGTFKRPPSFAWQATGASRRRVSRTSCVRCRPACGCPHGHWKRSSRRAADSSSCPRPRTAAVNEPDGAPCSCPWSRSRRVRVTSSASAAKPR
jgi:predicted DNA-binding transcriptional regulator YafY